MINLTFNNKTYQQKDDETVLDALLRGGVDAAFSCRNGICQTCLVRVTKGKVNEESLKGLNQRLLEKNYFMPCKCKPITDLVIEERRDADFITTAIISKKEMLSPNVCQIFLEPFQETLYHAGQFINIYKKNSSLTRSYSIASVVHHDSLLELHIKHHPLGIMSRWLIDDLSVGDELEFTQPIGNCFYKSDSVDQCLLLVGSGTGLAPLIGVARDALLSGHKKEIWLYHGAVSQADLYQDEKLRILERQHHNFHYVPCVLNESSAHEVRTGNVVDLAFAKHSELSNWLVYLAGDPIITTTATKAAKLSGAPKNCIYADPFIENEIPGTKSDVHASFDATENNKQTNEVSYPAPVPELWEALGDGKILHKILDNFYDAVFEDPILSPYFEHSTKQRAKEKVYSFYRRIFTGEKVYFGDRPRNAHHWMVISDSIFDHRENLLEHYMRKHNLSEEMIYKWQQLEELYRPDMVKDKPRGRMIGDIQTPASGFGKVSLDVGGMCDSCSNEIDAGLEVTYHLRTGEVFCPACTEG